MFQEGQLVVYSMHGVCKILPLETRTVDRRKVEYYVLEPLEQPGTRFYVPSQNQAALSKMSPLMTRQELDTLLAAHAQEEDVWIEEENRRKQYYREVIGSGDRAALVAMVRSLHRHRSEQVAAGRKFHLCDENFLRDAEKLLSAEFSLILEIPQDEVGAYIQNACK